jgi:hypothetical protein
MSQIIKKEYSSVDANPSVVYAKTDQSSQNATALVATTNGALMISSGLNIPSFDYIDFTNLSGILFYSGGVTGILVATINITGTTLTRT